MFKFLFSFEFPALEVPRLKFKRQQIQNIFSCSVPYHI